MVEMNETTIRALAGRIGLPMQFVYKENKLFEALAKILTANQKNKYKIVLKGGTALNKIYFKDLQRFSEDIDFDIFTKDAKIEEIIQIEGFKLEGPWRFKDTIRYHLKYKFLNNEDSLRVEFAVNKLPHMVNQISNCEMSSNITGTILYGVPCYSFDDLVARKFNALRTRAKGKDIWDCYHAIDKTINLKKAIEQALKSEKIDMNVEEALQQSILKLKKVDVKEIMKLTNPYIPTSIRPKDWKEIVETLIDRIQNLYKLN